MSEVQCVFTARAVVRFASHRRHFNPLLCWRYAPLLSSWMQVLNRTSGAVEGRYCFVWTASVAQALVARRALDRFDMTDGSLLQVRQQNAAH